MVLLSGKSVVAGLYRKNRTTWMLNGTYTFVYRRKALVSEPDSFNTKVKIQSDFCRFQYAVHETSDHAFNGHCPFLSAYQ